MVDLFTVAGGLLVALFVVGAVLYLTVGHDIEWDEPTDETNSDLNEFGSKD